MNQKFIKRIEIAMALLVIFFVLYGGIKFIQSFLPTNSNLVANQSAVVTQIQSLNRLETASFTIEKIIDAEDSDTSKNIFKNILFGDKILLLAHANIIAGFDLSKLQASDVLVDHGILRIKLPAPEILVSKLDNDKTKIYDRKLGFLTKGNPQLESKARFEAENSLRKAACDQNILSIATENVKKQFQTIFLTAGFSEVNIEVPEAVCK